MDSLHGESKETRERVMLLSRVDKEVEELNLPNL